MSIYIKLNFYKINKHIKFNNKKMKLLKQFALFCIVLLLCLAIAVESASVKRDYVLKKFHFYPNRVIVPRSIF